MLSWLNTGCSTEVDNSSWNGPTPLADYPPICRPDLSTLIGFGSRSVDLLFFLCYDGQNYRVTVVVVVVADAAVVVAFPS